jgi:hypothetical protein
MMNLKDSHKSVTIHILHIWRTWLTVVTEDALSGEIKGTGIKMMEAGTGKLRSVTSGIPTSLSFCCDNNLLLSIIICVDHEECDIRVHCKMSFHALFQVTPYSVCSQWGKLDWLHVSKIVFLHDNMGQAVPWLKRLVAGLSP